MNQILNWNDNKNQIVLTEHNAWQKHQLISAHWNEQKPNIYKICNTDKQWNINQCPCTPWFPTAQGSHTYGEPRQAERYDTLKTNQFCC